jgi:uncharacterized membrane protein YgcG
MSGGTPPAGHWWRLGSLHWWAAFVLAVLVVAVASFLGGFLAGGDQPQPAFEPPVAVSLSRLGATDAAGDPTPAPLPSLRKREPATGVVAVSGRAAGGRGSSEGGSPGGNSASSGVGPSGGGGNAEREQAKTPPRSQPTETVPESAPTETVPESPHVSTVGKEGK